MYCVYLHKNPVTFEVFYVGIGNKVRPYAKGGRNQAWINYVNKYGQPIVEIVSTGLQKEVACEEEKRLIKFYGRKFVDDYGTLLNFSEGGDFSGTTGRKMVGVVYGDRNGEKNSNYGKRWTQEQRERMSKQRKGLFAGNNNPYAGKKHPPEVLEKMSKVHKGKKIPIEVRRKLGRKGGENHNAKKVIDTANGIVYGSIKDAAIAIGMNHSTLKNMVNGGKRNKTTLKFL